MKYKQRNLILGILLIIITACSKNDEYFTIGSDFLDSKTYMIMVDTFRVDLSTVKIDSLPSSAVDTLLIGNYRDDVFGRISCNSFFEFGIPSIVDVENDDIYDSITLELNYTGYSYGDTLQPLIFSIHLLSEKLKLYESGYLYNTSEFNYIVTPLAECHLMPHPASCDSTIELKLNNDFGKELFALMETNDDLINSESEFITHYKGLAIISDTMQNASIVAFESSDADININIYSHRIGEELKKITHEFPLVNSEKQFTCITSNYINTPLKNIRIQREDIPSGKMENRAYVQGGVGLMTKVRFPTVKDFLLFQNSFIIKAELIIRPAAGSYQDYSLPEDVYLYHTDKDNNLGNILYNSDGTALSPVFSFDELYNDQTYYLYDVTNFLNNELSDSYFDPEHGLLVTLSNRDYLCSFDRIVFEDESTKPQLRIYYVTY